LPVKLRVKFEHCDADDGKKVINDARAKQTVDARMKMTVKIRLGMTGQMIVPEYMQVGSRTVRRFRTLTT